MADTQIKAKEYAQAALELLDEADREFARCNFGLTSEKLWEAASHAIKAVCVRRGWQHDEYDDFLKAVKRITEETGDKSLYSCFRIAYNGQLFIGSLDEDDVDTDRPIVRELVDKMLAAAQTCDQSD